MRNHIIAYNYTPNFMNDIANYTTVCHDFRTEIILEINEDYITDSKIEEIIYEHTTQSDMVASICNINDINEQVYLYDLCPLDEAREIGKESEGGDIRKYLHQISLGYDYNIRVDTDRSNKPKTTGFEPISTKTVRTLIDYNVYKDVMSLNGHYPSVGRLLIWSDFVSEKFDLDCGIIGDFMIDEPPNPTIEATADGFVIYNATDNIFKWIKNNWKNNTDLFMRPDELDFVKDVNKNISANSYIRLWWD